MTLTILEFSDDAATVVYTATARRRMGDPYQAIMARTYSRQDGWWLLVVHQQTLMMAS